MAQVADTKRVLTGTAGPTSLQQLIEKSAKEFKKALPKHMRPERLVRIALTCIRQNPDLAQCTPASFVGALLVSAQLGLEPVGGRAYILPFRNSKTGMRDAQFIVGYKGLADLFYRHEKSVQLMWGEVKQNDEFEYEYGTDAKLRHRPAMKNGGETLGYYVIAELAGGAKPFLYMPKEDCMEHGKKHSKTYDKKTGNFYSSSPWFTDPGSMCKKTVLIQFGKLLPLSIELQQAIGADETSREYREGIDNALDIPASTWNAEDANITENGAEGGGNGGSAQLAMPAQIKTICDKAAKKVIDTTPDTIKATLYPDMTLDQGNAVLSMASGIEGEIELDEWVQKLDVVVGKNTEG